MCAGEVLERVLLLNVDVALAKVFLEPAPTDVLCFHFVGDVRRSVGGRSGIRIVTGSENGLGAEQLSVVGGGHKVEALGRCTAHYRSEVIVGKRELLSVVIDG